MSKGLPRSLSRGRAALQEVVRIDLPINVSFFVEGTTGVGYGTGVITGLPEGNIKLLACVINCVITKGDAQISDAFNGDFGLGTTPLTDGTITGGDVDIVPSTATVLAVSGVSTGNRGVSTASQEVIIDNTAGALEVNFNLLIDD